nr:MAG TPA: tail protein [Caudoviricetes sp.]
MPGQFTTKRIRIEICLKAGKFDDGNDVVIIDDLPMHVEIVKAGIPSFPEATISIWGLSLSKMKALSMKGHVALQSYRNRVKVYAGEGDPDQLPLVFVGDESFGATSIDASGEAVFNMKAFTGIYAALSPTKPMSVQGTVPAADIIRQFANEAGFSFVNQGVTTQLTDCVITGNSINKMQTVADAIGADLIIDDQTVILLPRDSSRDSPYLTISPQTGMLGYPSINSQGITVTFIFNPAIVFRQMIHVESVIPMATGDHSVIKLQHVIDANRNDGGAWQTTIESWFNYGL